jgi:hypothetical protein
MYFSITAALNILMNVLFKVVCLGTYTMMAAAVPLLEALSAVLCLKVIKCILHCFWIHGDVTKSPSPLKSSSVFLKETRMQQ